LPEEVKKPNKKLAALIATVLWVLGFGFAFVFPKGSPFLWLSDAFLLLGFWPLLFAARAKILWIIFGVFNFGIGAVLLVTQFLGDENFAGRQDILLVKAHLAEYHFPYVWLLVGIVSTVIGLVASTVALFGWLKKRAGATAD
jgi:hypothetical protein